MPFRESWSAPRPPDKGGEFPGGNERRVKRCGLWGNWRLSRCLPLRLNQQGQPAEPCGGTPGLDSQPRSDRSAPAPTMTEFAIIPIKTSHARIGGFKRTLRLDFGPFACQGGSFGRFQLAVHASHSITFLQPVGLGHPGGFQQIEVRPQARPRSDHRRHRTPPRATRENPGRRTRKRTRPAGRQSLVPVTSRDTLPDAAYRAPDHTRSSTERFLRHRGRGVFHPSRATKSAM
jgi:hypothetical protein